MSDPLLTPLPLDQAKAIGDEVRQDYRAAVADAKQMASALDEISRLKSRASPPPSGPGAVRAVRFSK